MMARWWLPPLVIALGAPLWLHWWEPAMFIAINQACAIVPTLVWTTLSLGGNVWGVLALTAPFLVLAPRFLWAWLCAAPLAAVFVRLGKEYLPSLRPAAVIDHAQMHFVGEPLELASMPSGHTLTAFAVVGSIYFSVAQDRRASFAWLWLLAALVGLSRMALGAHWPGDVLVGAALGLWAAAVGQLLFTRLGSAFTDPRNWRMRALAATLGLCLWQLLDAPLDYDENRAPQKVLAALVGLVLLRFTYQQRRGQANEQEIK